MSKPSDTNYPKTFRMKTLSYVSPANCQTVYFWWLLSGCSPLPIPNREVKPRIADDTAFICGKVGRRQSFYWKLEILLGLSLFLYIPHHWCNIQIQARWIFSPKFWQHKVEKKSTEIWCSRVKWLLLCWIMRRYNHLTKDTQFLCFWEKNVVNDNSKTDKCQQINCQ